MTVTYRLGVVAAFVAIGGLLFGLATPQLWPWHYTQSVHQYQGRYFRMVVKVDYHGEPELFDFVVGCNVRSTQWADGGMSREVGIIPAYYGHRMKDNHAVVIRPPDVCNGQTTANGAVPPGFMPLIIVYDNADTLEQGLAYLSDDAYASPRSELKFNAAEIDASTAEDFATSMKTGVPNVVTRERYWSYQAPDVIKAKGVKVTEPSMGQDCRWVTRWPLDEAVRKKAAAAWPADRPHYWLATDWKAEDHILDGLDRDSFRGVLTEDLPEYGMPRRDGLYRIESNDYMRFNNPYPLAEFYPYWKATDNREWPRDTSQWPAYVRSIQGKTQHRILLDNGTWRGFGICSTVAPFYLQFLQTQKGPFTGNIAVDDTIVAANGQKVYFVGSPQWVFEDDKFVFEISGANTNIVGGDVK